MHDKVYIEKCLTEIERKLQWASREKWVYEDFKQLQGLIFDASTIQLSVHTLERLFGKLKTQENYNPQIETKNALAIFLGYTSWSHYKSDNKLVALDYLPTGSAVGIEEKAIATDDVLKNNDSASAILFPTAGAPGQRPSKRRLHTIILATISCCACLALLYVFMRPKSTTTTAVALHVANAFGHIPHTAKFSYDGLDPKIDNLTVDFGEGEDWNVSENQSTFFKTYMTTGIFDVALKQYSRIVAKTNVFIDTQGWKGYIYTTYEDKKTRKLMPTTSLRSQSRLYTSPLLLHDTLRKNIYFIEYNLVHDFGVNGADLTFDTRFRSNTNNGGRLCNDMWFKLTGTQGMLKMHFLVVGCSGYTQMIFGEQNLDGRVQDLSAFTRNFSDWKIARLKVVDKQVSIYFDNKLIYKTSHQRSIGGIMAISITSKGSGETDYVRLYDRNMKLAFADDFK